MITASDKGAAGEREDLSGPAVSEMLTKQGYQVEHRVLLPDDEELLYREMVRLADEEAVDVIFTTGGTGLSKRIARRRPHCGRLTEMCRNCRGHQGAQPFHHTKGYAQPWGERDAGADPDHKSAGSPKAVRECLEYILPSLEHGI